MARFAVTIRLIALGVLIVVLLIPLVMINVLTGERAARRETVFNEIAAVWGGAQTVSGPVLSIPFTVVVGRMDGRPAGQPGTEADGAGRRVRRVLHVTALDATVDVTAVPEIRRRGIFEAPVYTATIKLAGRFARPGPATFGADVESIAWQDARLSIGLKDPNGVASQPAMTWGGRPLEVEPGTAEVPSPSLSARVPGLDQVTEGATVSFEATLGIRGGRSLMLSPLARTSSVAMKSAWPSPSFGGARLPDRYQVNDSGFSAEWRVSSFGRSVPQAWTDLDLAPGTAREQIDRQAFGATMATPVDVYQQADRSTKYGILFVALTFLAFFLVETLRRVPVHPVQYLMVGAALCLFYLLLLSLSEHLGFTPAYLIAAVSTIGLIGGYARSALRGLQPAAMVTALLAALYGCLYVLLRLEDYALMTGSLVLFVILAVVMFVTRRVDWYEAGNGVTA
jgi:inner membrane protein